ncbi:phosphopyruvate hydratase, partial [Candidatus Bathyarchaeota archaeon]
GPDVQEMLVLPVGATDVLEALQANFLVHRRAGEQLARADPGFTGGRGDEGAWAPKLGTEEALEVLAKACEDVAGELGFEVRMGLDVAASTLWREEENAYVYEREGMKRDRGEQVDFILELVERFKLIYVEDPLAEEDFEGFAELTRKARRLGCLICGDDLFVTSVERIARGAELGAATAIIIKPNQVGTLSDTADAVRAAREAGMVPVASHRSGESTDPHLAHLAVGLRCPIIKTGVLGGERVAKLNELLRIAEELGEVAKMAKLPVA